MILLHPDLKPFQDKATLECEPLGMIHFGWYEVKDVEMEEHQWSFVFVL